MHEPLSTADVPPQFLKDALLLGQIPWRALPSDPRVSYSLYIPPRHYNPSLTAASPPAEKLPLLVYIHGTRRNISAIDSSDDLVPFAEETPCAVLAPLFPVGLDGVHDLDSYKILASRTLRADLALLAMLDEVARRWPGVDAQRVYLMGFSGGGQFAHRFLYLYPERIGAVSVGAPGRVTMLDRTRQWPGGIGGVEGLFGRGVSVESIRRVRIQLVVGREDNVLHGGNGFWEWVREFKAKAKAKERERSKAMIGENGAMAEHGIEHGDAAEQSAGLEDMRQGRLDTITELHALWRDQGIHARLDIIEGMAHEQKPARGVVLEFLRGAMLSVRANGKAAVH
ncbi:poly(aspartic acid) hydrolase [Cladophialophora carrionii]|uniref:Poly(Aspartic acid) hydrolase n=1 Tax=Cladophialophora carrionii TaxID=86049 RepID=A0A1C1CUW6_9EURO|nr:poly(aspartic acid) hydrolase [Cladophialophora carrionii]